MLPSFRDCWSRLILSDRVSGGPSYKVHGLVQVPLEQNWLVGQSQLVEHDDGGGQ